MVKKLILTILLVIFCLPVSAQQEQIKVKIVDNQSTIKIRLATGELNIADKQKITTNPVYISIQGDSLALDDKPLGKNHLTINQPLEVNNRLYAGKIDIKLSSGSINVINTLPLEEFLYNTVTNQTQPLWAKEAICAQAVVNRTLAMYHKAQNKAQDFDILALTEQFYTGAGEVREEVKINVDKTIGQILVWQDSPIYAAFHQSSGSVTDSGDLPYLVSVQDYDQDSPDFSWQKMFSAKAFNDVFKYAGYASIGKVQAIELTPMDFTHKKQIVNRSISGRVTQIKIIGDRGFVVLSGTDFAKLLQLPSSAFDIVMANLIPKEVDVPITDIYGNVVGSKKIPIELDTKPLFLPNRPLAQRINWSDNEKIIIKGKGKGSGVGFSQWGARALALSGKDYRAILQYYYAKVDIEKIY